MSPLDVVVSADVLGAVALLVLVGLLEPVLEYRLLRLAGDGRFVEWSVEHVFAPLLRAVVVAAFALIAYPALYGVRSAPDVATLLADGSLRLTSLVNVLFVISVLLPALVPNFNRTAWLVPLQGLLATAIVFGWYTSYIGAASIGWWPGAAPAAVVAVMVVISHRLAAESGQLLGQRIDRLCGTHGFETLVPNATELVAQLPAVLYYGMSLGRQIAI